MNWIETYTEDHKTNNKSLIMFYGEYSSDNCNHLWLDTDILSDLYEREHTCILCGIEKIITEKKWRELQFEHKIVKDRIGTLKL